MPTPRLSREELLETLRIYREHGENQAATATTLGLARSTLQSRLKTATREGLDGSVPHPAPYGFSVKQNTVAYDKNGEKTSQSVKFAEESGGAFEVATGHAVKGVSSLVDADGNIKQQWIKTDAKAKEVEDTYQVFSQLIKDFKPKAPKILKPKKVIDNKLSVYIVTDWHLGMLAWGEETGEDWDLSIARKKIFECFENVVAATPPSKQALFLGLGDLLHSDNSQNRTQKSGNALDVDGRYGKVVDTANDLLFDCVSLAASHHKNTDVRLLHGNHDEHTTVGLASFLAGRFWDEKRVNVIRSQNPYFYTKHGVNMIGGTHGHTVKMKDLPMVMRVDQEDHLAGCVTKHFHTGHIHHESALEEGGVVVHSHRAPIAADAYHHASRYRSGRSIKSYTYNKTTGAVGYSEEPLV